MKESKGRLLIVDDEKVFRLYVREHLEDEGYEVEEARDGLEALEKFEREPSRFDLVITDLKMPRMRGEQLISELRMRRRFLPIIGVTGWGDLRGRLRLLDSGAYYFFDKPVADWPIVDRLVENAIRLHRHEEKVHRFRDKEKRIARMLRAYILRNPLDLAELPVREDLRWRVELAHHPIESSHPSGDHVDAFYRNGTELLFYLSDASGHHDLVPAFTSCVSTMVLHRSHHNHAPTVEELIHLIDCTLGDLRSVGAFDSNNFLTFFIGTIDLRSGALSYVNAGHPPALIFRADANGAEPEPLPHTCQSVGHMSLFGTKPKARQVKLHRGDLLFVYTDGASDLLKGNGREHVGTQRLSDLVKPLAAERPVAIVEKVVAHLHEKAGGEFADDTTVMAIKLIEP